MTRGPCGRPMTKPASILLLALAGCASPPPPFSLDVEAALEQSTRERRPLLVLSVVGDLDGRL